MILENNLPFPTVVVKLNSEILTINQHFQDEFLYNFEFCKISELIPDFNPGIKEQVVFIRSRCYKVFSTNNKEEGTLTLYFIFQDYFEENSFNLNKVAVSLIFIDNYTEVLNTVEEFRHPLAVALIERKVNKLARDLSGIVKKFEKDKYIFIFSQDKLEYLKENKFSILDSIREIDINNKIPFTLSIGIGLNAPSLNLCMEFARASIDLALSRGGDQVVIKDNEVYEFFGGHSKEIGVNTRVRARVKAFALTELIESSSNVFVMGHKYPDLDALGSAIGVYAISNALGKKCNVILNEFNTSIRALILRLKEDEHYNNLFISSSEAMAKINNKTLLIVVDTHKQQMCECSEIFEKAKKVVVFDHHRKGKDSIENPLLTYHEPFASSTCELITEMLTYMTKPVNLKDLDADALLAGITVDTKNFEFKTGTKTFEVAAFLKRNGADTMRIKTLFQNSIENYSAKAEIVKNAEIFNENMAIGVCNYEVENSLLLSAQSADDLLNIAGITSCFVLCPVGNRVSISARSLGTLNVQVIMEKLGGGGHQTISATQIPDCTLDEAIYLLKETINKYLEEEL